MDHHAIAAVSIVGICFDLLGSLYLAYDLLGGQHGPLRLITRAVTYTIMFGIGYGLGLGFLFGLVAGIASGFTISIELNRASRGLEFILFRGKYCSAQYAATLSDLDSTKLWASDSPSPLAL